MKNLLRTTVIKLLAFFKGALCGVLISLCPVILVNHKQLLLYFLNLDWAMLGFFVFSIMTGAIVCFLKPSLPSKKDWAALAYLFLYTACAVLCQKLGITVMAVNPFQFDFAVSPNSATLLTMVPGIVLIALAAMHFVKTAIKPHQYYYLSWLLFMAGIALIFGVWLPLIALPGAWVAIKWFD
jgi:hypothetical protein